MRVVLDTNIFISAFLSREGVPNLVLELWFERKYSLVTSEYQIEELRDVTRRDEIKPYLTPHAVGRVINLLRTDAVVLGDLPQVDLSPDPKDNPILAAGIEGQVQYIVSGDKGDLLALEKVMGIPIVTAREFMKTFAKQP
ncbi:MAG: putative toxin-antitoxin system toxin component, PIN family [Trueperaceae bacterium]|nr:MAG: putative toxin-antitoxin system toxin component, PIN family [Trueperaceae bacterium]